MSKLRVVRRTCLIWTFACGLLAGAAAAGDSPWHVAGRLGSVASDHDLGSPPFGWSLDDDDVAKSLEVGYRWHRHLVVQAGYHDLGSHRGEPRPCLDPVTCPLTASGGGSLLPVYAVRAEITGYSLALLPRWPIGRRLALYGKAGYFDWEAKLARAGDGRPAADPFHGGELLLGAGAQYELPSGLGALVELEDFGIARSLSVGASWRF